MSIKQTPTTTTTEDRSTPVPAETKQEHAAKVGFWRSVALAAMEIAANALYRGPR